MRLNHVLQQLDLLLTQAQGWYAKVESVSTSLPMQHAAVASLHRFRDLQRRLRWIRSDLASSVLLQRVGLPPAEGMKDALKQLPDRIPSSVNDLEGSTSAFIFAVAGTLRCVSERVGGSDEKSRLIELAVELERSPNPAWGQVELK